MKLNFKRLAVLGILGYAALLALLLLAESGQPGSSINTISDAFWYSIVTLSTVGYGDMYPITVIGRIIGFCFVLMSLGVLSFVVGTVLRFMGRMLPVLQLRMCRDQQWYVFDEANEDSLALAKDLLTREPHCVCLFPSGQTDPEGNLRFYPGTMAQAVESKKDRCSLFFMGKASKNDNYKAALNALDLGHPVYACTDQVPADCPDSLTLFNPWDSCAREYWHARPLGKAETTVLLIGSGTYARRLLERALLVNVFGPDRRTGYHVFGDWGAFRRNHPRLGDTVSVNADVPGADCVFFHDAPWNDDGDLLYRADRIILCDDDDEVNLDILRQLRVYFPLRGQVHLRAVGDIPGETVFGTTQQICTRDLIMQGELTRTARMMHQIYADGANGQAAPWEQLSDFMQKSNIAAADHLLTKVRMLLDDEGITALTAENCAAAYARYCETKADHAEEYRHTEHLRWMRFHSLYNWQYAPLRDNAARRHHLLRPYEELPPEQQAKDDYAWELLGKIAEHI